MTKILAVGNDAALLYTRHLVLEHAGAAVQPASPIEALDWLRSTTFDLLLLCHTVSPKQADTLLQAARSSRSPCGVLLLGASECISPDGRLEERFDAREGPAALVRRVHSMLAAGRAPYTKLPHQRSAALTMMPGGSAVPAPRHSGIQSSRSDEAEV